MGVEQVVLRHDLQQPELDLERVLARREPGAVGDAEQVRVDGDGRLPKAMLSTTLAVFRPTPGSVSSASRVCGTSPPKSSISCWLSAKTFFALLRKSPMVLTGR